MPDPDNWQARMLAAIANLDESIKTGEKAPAVRALEIATQLLAEEAILDASEAAKKGPPC